MAELKEFSKFKNYFGDDIPDNTLKMAYINFSINGDESYNVVDDLKEQGIEPDVSFALPYSKMALFTKKEISEIKDDEFIKNLSTPAKLRAIAIQKTKNMAAGLGMGVK